MTGHLEVNTTLALDTARLVANDAIELADELAGLAREWTDVSYGWSGAAASSFTALWEEWHGSATKLIDGLEDSCERLAHAAVLYVEEDAQSAESFESTTTLDLGL